MSISDLCIKLHDEASTKEWSYVRRQPSAFMVGRMWATLGRTAVHRSFSDFRSVISVYLLYSNNVKKIRCIHCQVQVQVLILGAYVAQSP